MSDDPHFIQEDREAREKMAFEENMRAIGRKIMVMSGKGRVGKSSLAANIAVGLHAEESA